jgi:hypothetical protein
MSESGTGQRSFSKPNLAKGFGSGWDGQHRSSQNGSAADDGQSHRVPPNSVVGDIPGSGIVTPTIPPKSGRA